MSFICAGQWPSNEIELDCPSGRTVKLKAKWNLESEQDLRALHGITSLADELSRQINEDIDRFAANTMLTELKLT